VFSISLLLPRALARCRRRSEHRIIEGNPNIRALRCVVMIVPPAACRSFLIGITTTARYNNWRGEPKLGLQVDRRGINVLQTRSGHGGFEYLLLFDHLGD
jgi:hypothetical protein